MVNTLLKQEKVKFWNFAILVIIVLNRKKDKSVINIAMAESNVNLDDVVVIGYGSQKKESVVSSVNTMKPAEIAIPTRSLSNTIAGQVAGVIAIQRSGEPGNDDADF